MRVTSGKATRRKHKKTLAAAKGYRMTRSKLYRVAKQAVMHAGQYAYDHRKKRKGQIRGTWIERINIAAREEGLTYNEVIAKSAAANIKLNRKVLADLAVNHPTAFTAVVKSF